MKLHSLRPSLAAVALLALVIPARAFQSGGSEVPKLARAKAKYEQDVDALSRALADQVRKKQVDLTPVVIPVAFDLVAVNAKTLRMEQELKLLAQEGEWPASAANDIATQTTSGTLKAALKMEYKTAYEAAHRAGDSKAQDVYVVESDAIARVTELARWKPLLESASPAAGSPAWIRSKGGWLSPNFKETQAPAGALRLPASAVPKRAQYKLEIVYERVDAGDGIRFAFLDAGGRPVEARLPAAVLDSAQSNRIFGKEGVCVVITVLDAFARIEIEGRTLQHFPRDVAAPAVEAAPETALLELLPEGNLRIRVLSLAWKPLRDVKQESMLDEATVAALPDCSSQPPVELASLLELGRAKAAYEESVTQFAQEVGAELRKRMELYPGEDLAKANKRRTDLKEEQRQFEVEGLWPASLKNDLAFRSKWDAARRPLTVAYWKAGSEANRAGQPCLLQRLVTEFEVDQGMTDYAGWQPLLLHLVNGRNFDASRPLMPLKFAGAVPQRYKLEFVVAREGDGGGFLIRGNEPSSGRFEYRVSKFDLDAGGRGGVFARKGARFMVLAQPGYARIEMEGRTLWQRPGDPETALDPAVAPEDLWLELIPDENTKLTARGLQWKPIASVPAPDKANSAAEPTGPAPRKAKVGG
ncbi:MAG TPA: hypothetical protein VM509_01800 [Planctomycetota bacterium]|nr:hypothetical protein [Planctomycetota bacterium]